MIGDIDNIMRVLSSILDMAHGVLPDDDFTITMVIRSKNADVPAHFLIGDDPEPVVAETLREIGKGPVIIGEASQDKTEPQARFGAVHLGLDLAAPNGDCSAEVAIDTSKVPHEIVSMKINDPAEDRYKDHCAACDTPEAYRINLPEGWQEGDPLPEGLAVHSTLRDPRRFSFRGDPARQDRVYFYGEDA
jgi:hypothetical protein